MPHIVEFLEVFHQLGQLFGSRLGYLGFHFTDTEYEQGFFPILESLCNKIQQFVTFLDNDCKLGVDFA